MINSYLDRRGRPSDSRSSRPASGRGQRVAASLVVWLCAVLLVCFVTPVLKAQELDERAIKVAYVFNLTKFVEWPHAGNQLVIGFIGDGPMGAALETMLAGKSSNSRPIRVVLLTKNNPLDQCDVLYISFSSQKKVHAALDQLRNKNVLTVGDTDSFPKDGGMVGLVRVGQQVHMQINLEALQRAGLKISSQVLSLATIVRDASEARN